MRWTVPSFVIPVALALLILGVPRFISSLLKAPAHATLTQVEAGKVPPPDQLDRAAKHLEKVRPWESSAELSAEIGSLRLLQAFQMDETDPDRVSVAGLATANLMESLRLSPARPHPWVRLAYAKDMTGTPNSEITSLLEQSVAVGPFVGEISLVRLKLLLKKWDSLSPDMRRYTFKQVRYMWVHDENFVIRAARQTSRPYIIRFALRPVPGALDRFDRAVPR